MLRQSFNKNIILFITNNVKNNNTLLRISPNHICNTIVAIKSTIKLLINIIDYNTCY